jgi:hypothetical protein
MAQVAAGEVVECFDRALPRHAHLLDDASDIPLTLSHLCHQLGIVQSV